MRTIHRGALLATLLAAPAAAQPFTLLIREDAAALAARNDPLKAAAYWQGFAAYGKAMADAGVLRGGTALTPVATADTVRTGKATAAPPAAPQVSGYFIIDVPSHDAALGWARKLPGNALVEVRTAVPSPAMQ